MSRFGRPSPALLISIVALFVALGGAAYAVKTAPKNSVTSKSIKNNQVKGVDVKDDAVTGADVLESSLVGVEGPPGQDGQDGQNGAPGSNDVVGRSVDDAQCNNDQTAPGEAQAGQFLPCTSALSVPHSRDMKVLVTAGIGIHDRSNGDTVGECRIEATVPGVLDASDTIRMGDTQSTSAADSRREYATITYISPQGGNDPVYWGAQQTPQFYVACREQAGDMDWREISLTAVALGSG
jgi:hypothetical protein